MHLINSHRFGVATEPVDNSFKMEFTTTLPSETVYMPIQSSDATGKLVFDDGTADIIGVAGNASHTFANAGTYIIKYYGTATSLSWVTATTPQKQYLTKILDWGITGATSAKFQYCSSLLSVAGNLESTTTSLLYCFANQTGNPDVSLLDTSNVTNMASMFSYCTVANPDVSRWNTSNVTNMSRMFEVSPAANPDVSLWSVSNVANMSLIFYNATAANPDVSSWNTSNVTNMYRLFMNSLSDPDTSLWSFELTTNYYQIMVNSGISTANYDKFLIRLNDERITHSLTGRGIGDIPSTYTTGVSGAARTALLANGWTFTDDGGI